MFALQMFFVALPTILVVGGALTGHWLVAAVGAVLLASQNYHMEKGE